MTGDRWGDDILIDTGCAFLLDDTADDVGGYYCESSLSVGSAADRAELLVSFPTDELRRVGFGGDIGGRQPAKRGRILVGNTMETASVGAPDFDDPIVIDAVRDPSDLRAIGTKISRFCEVWADDGYRITVCFDSLTDLFEHHDPDVVFQFTHALTKRLEAVDAVAHFHVDPDAHGEQLLATFEELFAEVVVEFEADEDAVGLGGGHSRASDADVARSIDEQPSESSSGEASDDDIAEALRD